VLAILATAGCSHGTVSELPTAPTPPAATITSLTITPVGGGSMIEGLTLPIMADGPFPSTGATLGAFAQYSDGSGKYIAANWTSSDDTIVSVDGTTLSAKARGTAIVTAAAAGKTASETFVVQPGIAGTWAGTYVVDNCQAGSGSMYELICYPMNQGRTPGVLAIGATPPIAFQITKSGTDLTATAQLGELRGRLTGSDRGQNYLTLKGDLTVNATTITVVYWDARVREDVMEGVIGFEVRITGLPSHANVVARLDKVTRR
jgi:hypothetical protein